MGGSVAILVDYPSNPEFRLRSVSAESMTNWRYFEEPLSVNKRLDSRIQEIPERHCPRIAPSNSIIFDELARRKINSKALRGQIREKFGLLESSDLF